jgi:DNA invertase Pin-like site-specific DNA recombinase
MRAFGYVRAARGENAVEQVEAIQDFFRRELEPKGFTYAGTFEDHSTQAGLPLLQRPEGMRLSLKLAEPGDVVLVARTSKAFSGLRDLLRTARIWRERGVVLHLLDLGVNTADQEGVNAMYLLSQAMRIDSEGRSERIGEALHSRRIAGRPSGRAPLGYRIVTKGGKKKLAPDLKIRRIGRLVREWRDAGFGWHAIYWALVRRGERNAWGREYSVAALQRICVACARIEAAEIKREMEQGLATTEAGA